VVVLEGLGWTTEVLVPLASPRLEDQRKMEPLALPSLIHTCLAGLEKLSLTELASSVTVGFRAAVVQQIEEVILAG
jgi:hypothetical protein